MSILEKTIKKILKNNKCRLNKRKFFSITLVVMFFLQLILPVGLALATSGVSESQESSIVEVLKEKDAEDKANAHSGATRSSAAESMESEEKSSLESNNSKEQESSSAESKEVDSSKPIEKPEEESSSQESVLPEPEEESSSQESITPEPEVVEEEDIDSSEESSEEEVAESEESVEESKEEEESEEESKEEDIEDPEESFIGYDGVDPSLIVGATALLYFAKGSLGPNKANSKMSLAEAETGELAPGEVQTSKTATRVPGTVNTWDIEVLIEGRDVESVETSDIVLVIDRSGSMSAGTRMQDAKNAANAFIETMLTDYIGIRIAVVSFSSDYGTANAVDIDSVGFSDDKLFLQGKVNDLVPLGGTHTQAAIIQGRALLTGSGANNKYMVLLSDGEPTFSYEPNNWENNTGTYKRGKYDGNFNVNKTVGTGNSIDRSYDNGFFSAVPRYRYINNGTAAIKAGTDAKVGIKSLYTIAVSTTSVGIGVLKDIASPNKAYSTENSLELEKIYDQIAGEISTQTAINNATITDEMGDGFTLVDGTIKTPAGTPIVVNKNGTNNQTITWNIPTQAYKKKEVAGKTIRYTSMTYQVVINPDILTAPVATEGATPDHNLFETNKITRLNYKDVEKKLQVKDIVSPQVDPVLLKIKKMLIDEAGNVVNQDPRLFDVQIKKDNSGFDQITNLVVGEDYQILTTLRKEGTYNIEEIGIDGDTAGLSKFSISYDIDDDVTSSFEVNHAGEIPRGDVVIKVTNEAITQAIDFIFIKMDSSVKPNSSGNPLKGSEFTLEKQDAEEGNTLVENTGIDPKFIFAGLTEGTYILTETKAPPGYKLPTSPWTITVVRNEGTGLLELQIPDNSFITGDKDAGYKVGNEEQKESEFPQTGGIGSLTYIIIGLTIVMSSLTIYSKKEQKTER